ncbi:matrix metalloproteinase-28 isoform X3 [Nycticebus coucang]|uniref:matrix metalloproteinase-28 isoform X3 n=1 Tax=Nycticebus coucang TaxID=9470 RepID=UPI00234D0EAE|nr:matrix metalloproteinase-28 isoform X3 [Nycticebus coucang]
MVARVVLLLRALPLLLCRRLDAEPAEHVGRELREEAEAFLEKYGYLSEHRLKGPISTRFSNAIREFQWVSQLPVSGVLDRATLRQMTRPRCGVADIDTHVAWTERISVLFAGRRAKMRRKKRFAKQGNKWYKQHLSYRLVNWPEHLPEPAVRGAVRAAFQLWSNVSALEFWEAPATGPADIRLTFFQGDHNDGLSNAFDGPGKPLGDSVAIQLQGKRFTDFEAWDSHSPQGRHPETQGPKYCHSSFDAITVDGQQRLYIFKGSHFWEVAADGNVSESNLLQEKWVGLPPNIEAAAVSLEDGDFYFFKGSRCWRFRGPKLVWGFPQLCRAGGLPRHPNAALFFTPLRRLILFKGAHYYVLARGGLQVEPYYPRSLQDWGGVPEEVSGALPRPDGSIIFFRDDRYWHLDQAKLRVTTSGLWATELPWMGCWHANSGGALF